MKKKLLGKMVTLAAEKHAGQFDKGGEPYILHCLAVMNFLDENSDEELQCIAVGHDLIEDTDVTYEYLLSVFGKRIADGIDDMTNVENDYEGYINDLMLNKDAVKVKMADLRHNSDIRRLKGVTEKDLARMAKYQRTYMKLKRHLETTQEE